MLFLGLGYFIYTFSVYLKLYQSLSMIFIMFLTQLMSLMAYFFLKNYFMKPK